MFSKYKKPSTPAVSAPAAALVTPTAEVTAISDAAKKVVRKAPQAEPAQVTQMDKERKRKERIGDLKLELHRVLLDSLNLSALEHASESDLRQEINHQRIP